MLRVLSRCCTFVLTSFLMTENVFEVHDSRRRNAAPLHIGTHLKLKHCFVQAHSSTFLHLLWRESGMHPEVQVPTSHSKLKFLRHLCSCGVGFEPGGLQRVNRLKDERRRVFFQTNGSKCVATFVAPPEGPEAEPEPNCQENCLTPTSWDKDLQFSWTHNLHPTWVLLHFKSESKRQLARKLKTTCFSWLIVQVPSPFLARKTTWPQLAENQQLYLLCKLRFLQPQFAEDCPLV